MDAQTTLVVYTPAVPSTHTELVYFQENNFAIMKRAQVLGEIQSSVMLSVVLVHTEKPLLAQWLLTFFDNRRLTAVHFGRNPQNYKSNLLYPTIVISQ